MLDQPFGRPGGAQWSVKEIAYDALERARVADDTQLFQMVASASFIETTTNLYTANLRAFLAGDDEVVAWLAQGWEPEELQHGLALRRYVECAWPDFDWEAGYRAFVADYGRLCVPEQLMPSRSLEMIARCVVETGTATFYRMLADLAPEPVLRSIAANISSDEVRHYKHFYRYFLRYRDRERPGRLAVARTLIARLHNISDEDTSIALKHVSGDANGYDAYHAAFCRLARTYFPYRMGVKMLLKPLGLGVFNRAAVPAGVAVARHLLG
jgi:hypothetical protein